MPAISPDQIERLMKQLGIVNEPIEASEVVIKTPTGDIVIKEPEVVKTKIKDKIIFQISGKFEEEPFSQEDIQLVMEQSGVDDVELVKKVLKEVKGDIVEAIVKLKEMKESSTS